MDSTARVRSSGSIPGTRQRFGYVALLIDSSHKRWFLITLLLGLVAVAVYAVISWNTPGGLTGGSIVGVWYGLLGSALMVYAGLLSALRKVPSWWWIGARKVWLKGHIWLGLLSGVLILCHSGFRWGGPLEVILWAVLLLTLATGVLGLALQQFLPRLMTVRVPSEAPFEQIPHLCGVLRRKAAETVAASGATGEGKTTLEKFCADEVLPFLGPRYCRSSPLANPFQAQVRFDRLRAVPALAAFRRPLDLLETYCDERRQLGEQQRLHYLMHGWLLVHVPLSVLLLVLGLAHAVMSLYY
jgi:hypothetical protein